MQLGLELREVAIQRLLKELIVVLELLFIANNFLSFHIFLLIKAVNFKLPPNNQAKRPEYKCE